MIALAPGSATAGGAGQGTVQNGVATGTGTGIAQAGPGINCLNFIQVEISAIRVYIT